MSHPAISSGEACRPMPSGFEAAGGELFSPAGVDLGAADSSAPTVPHAITTKAAAASRAVAYGRASNSIIPPLKGEVGERSEPGGVGCNNLVRRENPTRPPVALLRRSTSPERGGTRSL